MNFNDCIKAKEKSICQIKMDSKLTDLEKISMIAKLKAEIQRYYRVQIAIANRDLRRTKKSQYIYFEQLKS